ncbi:hypothetical protein NDU88_003490 [Pleurodeles waltl]|uniref:Uncharacterized protein n=1 Tax=Pleurodeles waltl TaxID=8319 RepID=A0AAV7KV05_PLEWA|nr:hypothetical protein NDU88_003490 [Pleurodeles waltl]
MNLSVPRFSRSVAGDPRSASQFAAWCVPPPASSLSSCFVRGLVRSPSTAFSSASRLRPSHVQDAGFSPPRGSALPLPVPTVTVVPLS